MGDVNGVGPEILVKAMCDARIRKHCVPVVLGSAKAWGEARRFAPNAPRAHVIGSLDELPVESGAVAIYEAGVVAPDLRPGTLDADAARCAVAWLRTAIRACMAGSLDGVVTCPINKEGLHLAGIRYTGHTEILAEETQSKDYRMCLFTDRMRIVHITSHYPLVEAIAMVKRDRIAESIRIGHDSLVRLGLERRRIAVAGLNPHAGEAGILGSEEAREIEPAVALCAGEGIDCSGPYPPDTVFRRMNEGEFDMVIAMYHDQGHIPLKLIAMDEGVNVTLGIPVVRTSVDHGTAYDIAWKGEARENSLCAAIDLAAKLARRRP